MGDNSSNEDNSGTDTRTNKTSEARSSESKTPTTVPMRGSSTGPHITDCDTRNHTIIAWQDCRSELAKVPFDGPSNWIHDDKLELYKHLDRNNSGLQNGWWKNTNYETYYLNYYLIDNISERIHLPPTLRGKAIGIFTGINLGDFGQRKEEVAVALCGWILYKETKRKTHPNVRSNQDELYQEAISTFNCRPKHVNRAFYRVEKAVKNGLKNRTTIYGKIQSPYDVSDPVAEGKTADSDAGI